MKDKDLHRLTAALQAMKATEPGASLTPDEEALLAHDAETRVQLQALARAQRALTEQGVPLPDVERELQRVTANSRQSARTARLAALRPHLLGALAGAAAMWIAVMAIGRWLPGTRGDTAAPTARHAATADTTLAHVATAEDETLTLHMADGTQVTLNANSRLDYPRRMRSGRRTVWLRGEALFRVSKDRRRPFLVHTTGLTTRVLGTTFDVRAYPGQRPSVALVEGRVQVTARGSRHALTMVPGQKVEAGPAGTLVATTANTDEETAWSDGQFYFDNRRLEDIMDELGRWYGVDVVFGTPALRDLRLHFATSRRSTAAETVELLNSMHHFHARLQNQQIVIEQP